MAFFGPAILLALLVVFHLIAGLSWIHTNEAIQGSDEVDYLQSALRFERFWPEDWSDPIFALKQITSFLGYAPAAPFTLILHKLGGDIFGRSLETARTIDLLGFLGTILILFFMGRSLGGSWAGICAAAMFSFYPYAFIQSRHFNGFSVTAFLITGAMALLFASKNLTRWWAVVGFGFLFGLALITERGTVPIIMVCPVTVYCLIAGYRQIRNAPKKLWQPILFLSIAALVTWSIAGRYVIEYALNNAGHNRDLIDNPYYPARAVFDFYLVKIPRWMVTHALSMLTFIAAVGLLAEGRRRRWVIGGAFLLSIILSLDAVPLSGDWAWLTLIFVAFLMAEIENALPLVAWLSLPLLVFSSFATKDLEYIYSLMPAAAILMALLFAHHAQKGGWRKITLSILLPLLIILMAWQFLAVSFPQSAFRAGYLKLPKYFRYANGVQEVGPQATGHKALATQVLESLSDPSSGILIYVPRTWINDPGCPTPTAFEANAGQMMIELQIYADYQNSGVDHILMPADWEPALPFADSGKNEIVFFDLNPEQMKGFRKNYDPAGYSGFDTLYSGEYVDKLLIRLPSRPVNSITSLPLFCDETLIIKAN